LADNESGKPATETSKANTASAQPTARPTVAETVHVVKAGESLSNIAIDYGASVDVIMVANGITDPTKLRVGQKLVIPSGTATPVPTATANPTASPTPAMPYKPPSLLWPINGTKLPAGEPVVLSWTSVGILDPEEYYMVRLERLRGPIVTESWTQWLQQTSWRVPASIRSAEPTKGQLYRWEIVVMRHTATNDDGTWTGIPLSNPSTERRFLWPLPLKQATGATSGSKVPGAPLPIPLSEGSK
jgi:murein DD-endopeptidase MepM/ murein hydrolase activator NlpD